MESSRPNPNVILARIAEDEVRKKKGHLRLFFGMAAGVGKTCAMLKAAHERLAEGVDVCIGVVETHGRIETQKLVSGLAFVPTKNIQYRDLSFEEMDLEAILVRKPQLVLIDEMAHTNVPSSRHEKRYQDILEILENGIDVYSTMNVQHLESRADIVQLITAVNVRETVPDSVLDRVDQIDLIDLTPRQLLERLQEGKVYPGRKTEQALQHFFQEGNLSALREMALRVTANKVERDMREIPLDGRGGVSHSVRRELLVAISHSPFSEKLIRTARRMAQDLDLSWVAVHVDTDRPLGREDQNQLVQNLNLAQEMGADTLTLHGTSIAAAITDYIKNHNVIQVVVGRPEQKRRWQNLGKLSSRFIEDLIDDNPHCDIVVLHHPGMEMKAKRKNQELCAPFPLGSYLKVILWVLLIAIANHQLDSVIGYRASGFIFLLFVIVSGLFFSTGPIFLAATLSALIWNFFFIPPRWTFTIGAPEDAMMFLAYFVIASVSGFLTHQVKNNQRILKSREEKTRALYDILRSMTLVQGIEPLIELARSKIEALFKAETSVFLAEQNKLLLQSSYGKLVLNDKDQAVATWCFDNGRMAGWSTDTLPMASIFCLCLKTGDKKFGILVYKPSVDRKLNPEEETLLFSITNQIAIALAKKQYDEEMKQSALLLESEKLHQTLLNCISHELRTPLTAIMGAATSLELQVSASENNQLLLSEIVLASEHLNHVFENLLDMTRIESGVIRLNREWFDVSELVREVVAKENRLLAKHNVNFVAATKTIYLFGDFHLLEHVLTNLLLNAANYSPLGSAITLTVESDNKSIHIHCRDQGAGIPDELLPVVFERFYRLPGTPTGGLGLGLSIAKNLVELHGGQIIVSRHASGGSIFSMIFPFQVPPVEIRELQP